MRNFVEVVREETNEETIIGCIKHLTYDLEEVLFQLEAHGCFVSHTPSPWIVTSNDPSSALTDNDLVIAASGEKKCRWFKLSGTSNTRPFRGAAVCCKNYPAEDMEGHK